jgi:ATP-dependent protease ClpP protease subunit
MKPSVLNHPALGRYMTALRSLYASSAADEQRPWYRAEAKDDGTAEVYVYDEISLWGITADDFVREVAGLNVSTINLHLNSPGGLVFDGIAIHNALRNHKATVNVSVDGLAASIASVIAMAGDTVTMGRGTRMMIHNPHGLAIGEATDMREYADLLDNAADDISGFYAERAGGERSEWLSRMATTTWYSAEQAVEAGLADSYTSDSGTENRDRFTPAGAVPAGRDNAAPASLETVKRSQLALARDRARRGGVSK